MSAAEGPVDLVLIWHFHQPDYRDPATSRALLPWVRLHATKDYLDMARRVVGRPGLAMTFNFTPVLVDQLEAAVRGEPDALFERLARPPAELTREERRELAARCVQAPRHAMERWPALAKLAARARLPDALSDADLLALECWFLLAWLDPMWHGEPAARRATSADRLDASHRDELLALHARLWAEVLPAYRALAAEERIELSATPYYHPILPLLVDTRSALRARHDLPQPRERFAEPGDARRQLERALARHAEVFGRAPGGVWPSEGSVSPEVAELAASLGVRWLATDEGVLLRSLPEGEFQRGASYRPWVLPTPAGEVALFFRDRELSDRIGFVYQQWDAKDAVDDFLARLRRIGGVHAGEQPPVVSVILDGENCWEGYEADGGPFLDRLYRALEEAPDVRLRTPSQVLDDASVLPMLSTLHSGSWIDADFHIWIGHPEKNRAWELLARARHAVGESANPAALEALLRAEGSDWFWWLGDDHYSADKELFDRLFRGHLRASYEAAGESAPPAVDVAIAPPPGRRPARTPSAPMRPVLDGRATHFYEWQPAGRLSFSSQGAAMHAGPGLASDLYYGFDRERLYLRVDFTAGAPPGAGYGLRIESIDPESIRLEIDSLARGAPTVRRVADGKSEAAPDASCRIETIVEIAIPLAVFALAPPQPFEALIQILEGGQPIESLPPGDVLRAVVPDDSFDPSAWAP
jgi:alpha-amylase/alpha-mannosidase (GH57 family)